MFLTLRLKYIFPVILSTRARIWTPHEDLYGRVADSMSHMSLAYWWIVLSLLNLDEPAVFKIDILVHFCSQRIHNFRTTDLRIEITWNIHNLYWCIFENTQLPILYCRVLKAVSTYQSVKNSLKLGHAKYWSTHTTLIIDTILNHTMKPSRCRILPSKIACPSTSNLYDKI